MKKITLVLLIFGVLTGCASQPKIGEVGGMRVDRNNLTLIYKAMPARITHFDEHWQSLEKDQWGNSKWTYFGSGLAVLAVAANSTPYAIGGTLIAALATADDKIFGPDKQNLAWTKASRAYICIQGFSTPLHVNKTLLASQVKSPDSINEMGDAYAARTLFDALTQVDYGLADRLRLNAVSTTPDWTALSASVKAAASADPAPKVSEEAFAKLTDNEKSKVTELAALLGRYKADLATCAAAN